jgi:hypothetical protein
LNHRFPNNERPKKKETKLEIKKGPESTKHGGTKRSNKEHRRYRNDSKDCANRTYKRK